MTVSDTEEGSVPEETKRLLNRAVGLLESVRLIAKWLLGVSIVVGVVVLALQLQVQTRNKDIQTTSESVNQMSADVDELQAIVEDLELFVNETRETTPEEAARNAAITAAVQEVPSIKAILCEAFPEATGCQPPAG